jgi:hypothetical protein
MGRRAQRNTPAWGLSKPRFAREPRGYRRRDSTGGPSQRRGGQRSGTNRQEGQTKEQLYNQAKRLNIEGRSSMNKSQLQRAVAAKRR